MNPTTRRLPRTALAWQVALYALLITLALVYVYPFLVQLATSVKTEADAAADPVSLVPDPLTWSAYARLFLRSDFPVWFANSAVVTILVTAGRVFFDALAGYALARLRFRGRGVVYAGLVVTADEED